MTNIGIKDTAEILPEKLKTLAEETMFAMKPMIQTLLMLLALTSASGLAGCQPTFGPVELDRIENPKEWKPQGPVDR